MSFGTKNSRKYPLSMLTLGSDRIVLSSDGYTYKTSDGSNAAHFEHTIAITDGDPIILTK